MISMIPITSPHEIMLEYLLLLLKSEPNVRPIDLAHRAGLDHDEFLLDTIFGVIPITEASAVALEKIFNRPAHFFVNLQKQYDDACAQNFED